MSLKCDVLIIGGGPAGLTAALLMSNKGLSTIILEKNDTCGSKSIKYDITEGNRIKKIIKEIGVLPNKISNRSEWISQNYNFILDSKIEDFYFKRGQEENSLENTILSKIKHDVNIFYESKIKSVKIENKEVKFIDFISHNKRIEIIPNYVIVANGPDSKFNKKFDIKPEHLSKFDGFGVLVKTTQKNLIPHTKIYLDEKNAPGGYIYSGSIDNDTFICFVTDDSLTPKKPTKNDITTFLKNKIKNKFHIENFFFGKGISGIQNVGEGNTLFIGGAAFFIDPFLGYGLNYAIESAYFAAKAIEKNDTSLYAKYTTKIHQELKNNFVAREIWRKADNTFYNNLIKAFNGKFEGSDKNIEKILDIFNEE